MELVDLILVGCGLMGGRHLRGYAELERVRPGSLRLRAVCDPRVEAAQRLAAGAEALLGYRPRVCRSAEEALELEPGIRVADVVTPPSSHPSVAILLLEAGIHVQIEKPLAVTVARGRAIIEAARRSGAVLSVAENYRRDPMNRLLKCIVATGCIGMPRMVTQISVTPGERVVVSPWRHTWAEGGLALDVGVHYADMLEYLLGPVDTVSCFSRRVRDTREWADGAEESRRVPVESNDCYVASLTFRLGVQGVWVMDFASASERHWQRSVQGSDAMVEGPRDRSGQPIRLQRGSEVLEGEDVIAACPDFRLGGIEAQLFGERPASSQKSFEEIDRRLIAVETADFLDAVRRSSGARAEEPRGPEVTGEIGLRSVALVMALLESSHAGRSVRVDEVLSGAVRDFQDRLEGP